MSDLDLTTHNRIFVNGTFDLIHPGHLDLLYYAKSLGDHLRVAIDGDQRVHQLKGENRPIQNQWVRKRIMESLKPVDEVFIFDSDSELEHLIAQYAPMVMVVGSDYTHKPVIGSAHAQHIQFFPRDVRYSTTQIIERAGGGRQLL